MMKRLYSALAALLLLAGAVRADQSTINPNVPATGAQLQSAPIRGNFAAAYSDINRIFATLINLNSVISPTIAADQNDWSPTGLSGAQTVRVNGGAADRNITGLGQSQTPLLYLENVGTTNNIVLKDSSGSSTNTFRFLIGADIIISPNQGVTLLYDATSLRWRSVNSTIPSPLPLSKGGTSAALTASLGGIFYSTASQGAILAGNVLVALPLLSGASAAPTWATITYPTSAVSGGIPYFSSTSNMITTAALGANQIMVGGGVGGAPTTFSCPTATTVVHGGTPPTCSQVSLTADVINILPLANGGSNANLAAAASNGGIVWSNATQFQILAGTVTARQMLQSGASGTPAWSTATWPATTTINRLLFSSAANTVTDLATANGGMLNTSATGVPSVTPTPVLGVAGTTVGSIGFQNATSGTVTIAPVAGALGANTMSVPAATDTFVGKATPDIFTNKTYDTAGTGNSFSINGVAVTANTGTGAVARATNAAFTTPSLGAATATSINGLAITGSTGTLTIANAKTLTVNNTLTFTGTDGNSFAFPSGSDTVVVLGAAQTLASKSLTSPIFTGTADVQQAFKRSGDISPTALSGDVNDYAPAGFSTASVIRQDGGAANRNITGLAGGADGVDVIFINTGATNSLVLKTESASSAAGNRFAIGGDVTLAPSQSATLWYDSTSSRWRISSSFTVAGGSPSGTVQSVICGTVTITLSGTCDNGVLLETLTASASASLTTSVSWAGFNRIQLVLEQYLPATDDSGCRLRVNVGGVQTTSYVTSASIISASSAAVTTYVPCSYLTGTTASLSNVAANGGLYAEIWISRPSNATVKKVINGTGGYIASNGAFATALFGGVYNGGNGAITGAEISQTSGNVTSGTVKVYGWN